MSFNEFKEYWVSSGVGTILAVMLPNQSKYQILWATTSIPSFAGSRESIDYSTTTNSTITKIPGKKTTNEVEVEIAWNRDTINLANEICDQDLKYAVIDLNDFTGWEFVANASYRMADVAPDSAKQMVLQLTVKSVESYASVDFYDLYMDTITFGELPQVVHLSLSKDATNGKTYKVVTEPSSATATANPSASTIATASLATGTLTIKPVAVGDTTIVVSASATDYASAKREILVIVEA